MIWFVLVYLVGAGVTLGMVVAHQTAKERKEQGPATVVVVLLLWWLAWLGVIGIKLAGNNSQIMKERRAQLLAEKESAQKEADEARERELRELDMQLNAFRERGHDIFRPDSPDLHL